MLAAPRQHARGDRATGGAALRGSRLIGKYGTGDCPRTERWAGMKRTWAIALAVGLAIAAQQSARAQLGPRDGESLKSLITGEVAATTKKLKELDGNWRRITLGGSPSEGKGV